MTGLANQYPELVSSEQLADSINTNPSFIRKLVVHLTAAGLVESVRGKAGGLRLAKSPKEITLDQVYKASMDNALLPVPQKAPNKTCEIACGMNTILCQISQEIEDNTLKHLAKRNLQDVLKQARK
jgi:Rrf2 family protein